MASYTSISTDAEGITTIMSIAEIPPPTVGRLINFLTDGKPLEILRETRAKSGDKYLLTVVFKLLA